MPSPAQAPAADYAALPVPPLAPSQVARLLLLWLGSLPEPLFPAALVPELVESQQSDYYEERLASVRGLLKRVRLAGLLARAGPGWVVPAAFAAVGERRALHAAAWLQYGLFHSVPASLSTLMATLQL